MKEKGLVPKRRFGEFKDSPPWENIFLGDMSVFSKGRGYSKKDIRKSGNPIILYGSLYTNYRTVIDTVDTFANLKENSVVSKGGELLIPSSGETAEDIARASVVSKPGIILGGDLNILNLQDKVDPVFLALSISSMRLKSLLMARAEGKSVVHLYNDDIKDIPIRITSKKEQNKIGLFFLKLDNLIELHEEKLSKLKNLKQSYLHKMFPQKGSDVPDMRFEGFSDKWIDKRLDSLFNKGGSGGTPSTNVNEYYEGNIPFLGISDITSSNGYIYSTEKHISAKGMNSSAAWLVPKESISLAMYASVGKVGILKVDSATSQAFYNMVFDDLIVRDFVFHTLDKMEKDGLWRTLISTGTQANLNAEKVKSLEIKIPDSNGEMKKISELLNSINLQINAQERKLDKLRQMKKAYLEEMFV